MSPPFAVTYPERTTALVLFGGYGATRRPRLPGGDPQRRYNAWWENRAMTRAAPWASTTGPPAWRTNPIPRALGALPPLAASPAAVLALVRMNAEIDVRPVLPPSACRHSSSTGRGRAISIAAGRNLAAHIPGAKLVELPGEDHLPWFGDVDGVVGEIEEFLTGVRHRGTRPGPRDGPVHGHGRLDPGSRRTRGPAWADCCSRTTCSSANSWRGSAATRSTPPATVPCHLRRPRRGRPLRPATDRGAVTPRHRDPGRGSHRRDRHRRR